VFATVLLIIAVGAVDPLTRTLQGRGYDVQRWQIFIGQLLTAGWLLAVAWPVWWVLDRIPFARGRRWRNGALRVALGGVVAALHGLWARGSLLLTVWLAGVDARLLMDPEFQWGRLAQDALANYALLVIAHMILQRSHEQRQQAALERSLAEARLHALSLELQPHFLFNTLNGIAALVRDDPRQAERMLLRLSELLHVTLREGAEGDIPLQRELEHLDLYLDLQSMRFGPRLTVVRDVDPATLRARVPRMLLQPLVENALTHGIGPRIGPGRIELTAQREGDALVLGVRDDGVGLPPSAERRERTGIGTTRARLAAMFGEAQRFTLAPAEGGGTEAVVRIPFTPSPAA
jgi:signal transduction histidine kinase